jgi:hypothetical protein
VTVDLVCGYGPVYFERVVRADADEEQDDAILDEDVEEGEAKAQKLQLL